MEKTKTQPRKKTAFARPPVVPAAASPVAPAEAKGPSFLLVAASLWLALSLLAVLVALIAGWSRKRKRAAQPASTDEGVPAAVPGLSRSKPDAAPAKDRRAEEGRSA